MRVGSGLRVAIARAGAGVAVAAGMAAAAVSPVEVAAPAGGPSGGPSGLDAAAIEATTGMPLPVATGPDGQPLPAVVGDPPDVGAGDPAAFLERAERASASAEAAPTSSGKARPGASDPAAPVVDEATLLVSFEEGTAPAATDAALEGAGVTGTPVEGTNTLVVDLPGADRDAVEATLAAAPGVTGVGPHLVRSADRVPNDPGRPAQDPYLTTVGLPTAWDVADTGARATVAVLDTGVDLDHPDLAPNLVAGYNAIAPGASAQDDNGHGTAVAGIIGAATDNGAGVAGVAWNARIMPVKVLDSAGRGTDARIAAGIRWAVDHGADVVNLSLGGAGTSTVLQSAVDYALAREVVVVAAAGNDGAPVPHFPAAFPGVVSVGATDAAGRTASFSNHGPWVLLSAPGIAVRTTGRANSNVHAVVDASGTSFSSPIVAGVAALLLERHPSWTGRSVVGQLVRTARDAGPAGVDDAYGYGVVDAAAALDVAPVAATSLPPTAGDAGNLPSAPRSIAVGATVTESLDYELDEDWFAFDVPSPSMVRVNVTPPPSGPATRAAEMDPIVEMYGPGGGLVGSVDLATGGIPENLDVRVPAGRHLVRVQNYYATRSPAAYSVRVTRSAPPVGPVFAPWASLFETTEHEDAVVVADVSGDGRDDVVMSTDVRLGGPEAFKLLVFTQQDGGRFSAPTLLATHANDRGHLSAADLDGDGDVDVAYTTAAGLDVAWNDGGGLADATLYPFGAVASVEAGDLDGDGASELVVVADDQVRVVRWTGTDLISEPIGVATPARHLFGAHLMGVGDVTGDGRPDIVGYQAGGVAVSPQQADGSWGAAVVTPLPPTSSTMIRTSLAIGDLSGDGRLDVAVVGSESPGRGHLAYLRQWPDGTLGLPIVMQGTPSAHPLEIADVTGDGLADAVALHGGSGSAGVYEQTASGTLWAERLIPLPPDSGYSGTGLGLGDLDGDGLGDLAIGDSNNGLVVVRHQDPAAPEQAPPGIVATSPAPHATGVATGAVPTVTFGRDVDPATVGAGTVCLMHGRDGCVGATVSITGRTLTVRPTAPLQPGNPYQVVVAGVLDTAGGTIGGAFPFVVAGAPGPVTPNVDGTYWPFRWNATADGWDDVLWYTPTAGADPLWLFGAGGRVEATGPLTGGTFTPVTGDFDGNGWDDVLWYAPGTAPDVMWFNGPGGIVHQTFTVNGTYIPLVGDFDRNGFDDIFWYGPGAPVESTWQFRAGRQYGVVAQRAVATVGYKVVAGDFNRDGYDDVLWYMPGPGIESVWRSGPAGFTPVAAPKATGTYEIRAGDTDGDGFDDVYFFAAGASTLWRGTTTGFASKAGPVIAPTARPVVGDFGGDNRDDLLAYVPGTTADPLYPGRSGGW